MSRNKKPRKAYRPRQIAVNTLELAMHHAAKPSQEDMRDVIGPIDACMTALRQGVATEGQWAIAAGSVQMALAIERQGIVRGLIEHLQSADRALQSIYKRAMATGQWKPTALYFHELDALREFFHFHKFQMQQLGRKEFIRAVDDAERQVRKEGHVPTLVRGPVSQLQEMAA